MLKVYTVKQAAELLQVSVTTMERLIREGALKPSKVRASLRITEDEINRYLASTRRA